MAGRRSNGYGLKTVKGTVSISGPQLRISLATLYKFGRDYASSFRWQWFHHFEKEPIGFVDDDRNPSKSESDKLNGDLRQDQPQTPISKNSIALIPYERKEISDLDVRIISVVVVSTNSLWMPFWQCVETGDSCIPYIGKPRNHVWATSSPCK